MARQHVIKYYARLIQKGTYREEDIPEDIRSEVIKLAITLPRRTEKTNVTETPVVSSDTVPVMRKHSIK